MKLKVLGSGQDAGIPHIGCYCPVCSKARKYKRHQRLAPSVAIFDENAHFCHMIDASPDFATQVDMLREEIRSVTRRGKIPLSSILLTHAHFGHCSGLWQLGDEALYEEGVPVFCTPRMKEFLSDSLPFKHLITGANIKICEIEPGVEFTLDGLTCIPIPVPHRSDLTDTVGYIVNAANRVIYIPDTDRWTDEIIKEIATCDIALIDGTFFSDDELLRFAEVPHPPIKATLRRLEQVDTEIYFTHINHTNAVNTRGRERREVEAKGFRIAHDGLTLII